MKVQNLNADKGRLPFAAGYGPSAIHRRSWIFMDSLAWYRTRLFNEETVLQPELFAAEVTEEVDEWE